MLTHKINALTVVLALFLGRKHNYSLTALYTDNLTQTCMHKQIFHITGYVIQDSTTPTVKDTLPTELLVTHTPTVVDGGAGEDVAGQCKCK